MKKTVCGRPPENDPGVMPLKGSVGFGDPNYGYLSNKCGRPGVWCNDTLPNGSKTFKMKIPSELGNSDCDMTCDISVQGKKCTSPPVPIPPSCFQGKAYQCYNPSRVTDTLAFCQSDWSGVETDRNKLLCCGNLESDSSTCRPDWCAANTNFCSDVMKKQCTFDKWGSDPTVTSACDNFLNVQNSLNSKCKDSAGKEVDCAKSLVYNAISQFYSVHSPTEDHPFIPKSIELCKQYPGLCDPILNANRGGTCRQLTKDKLNPELYKGRTYDPDGTNTLKLCGCFLKDDNYVLQGNANVACNGICSFPGTIPRSDGSGKPIQCSTDTCVLDNISVNVMNSSVGSVNLRQYCGQCTTDKPCQCYFNDVQIRDINSGVQSQINTNCNLCYHYNSDDPTKTVPIECGMVGPPPPTPPSPPSPSKNGYKWLLIVVIVIVILLVLGFGLWYIFS